MIAILVVLYGKEISESATISSLLTSGLVGAKVILHNNGPSEISISSEEQKKFDASGNDFVLANCIDNKPLSTIYNDFVRENSQCDVLSFFDDDSTIPKKYVSIITSREFEIELPKILSRIDSKIYYPLVDKRVFNDDGVMIGNNIFSIGSGLTLTKGVIEKFIKHQMELFDEHYALYGVDFSFFRRLHALQTKGERFSISSNFTLLHSLSKVESVQSKFRHDERLIDFALTVRHYPSTRLYLAFIKKNILCLLKLKIKDNILMVMTFLNGSHPRCAKLK
ncbi:glycosyl transferase [Enterobacter sp. JUb54]|uniref:glycosyltransferase family 2 protein n=1 Tax=Enterobacter sp. JUb54 TaxID=2724468 RepID=UPI00164E455D|nr:glycosyl transferase [Enterobacter sp. JUb54]QNK08297.1 glycosyl transferase [Enterobacter sp. JUb54]